MKRKVIKILGVFAGLVTLTSSVWAWRGTGMGLGMGPCGGYYPLAWTQQDPQQLQKFQNFLNETLPFRQKLLQLRGELMQLYAQPNPDWNAIAKKRQEIATIQTEIQKRARNYGLSYFGPGAFRGGMKGGWGGPWW